LIVAAYNAERKESGMHLHIYESKQTMGKDAAHHTYEAIANAIAEEGEANIILATGLSQLDMLACLATLDIDWSRVTAFHLDEYIGLPISHPASFRKYLKERFEDLVPDLRAFHYVDGENPDPRAECRRLGELISRLEVAVACVGIGENGHLAFNDPPADFETDEPFIVVDLDDACRRQQLGEGWFPTLNDVPLQAISMSIRQIMKSKLVVCTVPDLRKAEMVRLTIEGDVTNLVPASILQQHPRCHVFMDEPAASLLSSNTR
jgi:glucosamine-6-phosphate deaminase